MTQTIKQSSDEFKSIIDAANAWSEVNVDTRCILVMAQDEDSKRGIAFVHGTIYDIVRILVQSGEENEQIATAVRMAATALTSRKKVKTEKPTEA